MKCLKQLMVSLSLATAILALVASPAFSGSNPNGKPFVEINGQIIEVQEQVTDIQAAIDSILNMVGSFEEALTQVQDLVATHGALIADVQALIASNVTEIESINVVIAGLKNEVEAWQAQIEANAADIDICEANIDANELLIAYLDQYVSGKFTTLDELVEAVGADISKLEQEVIPGIEADIQLKQDIVTGTCPPGQALQQINPDGTVVCASPTQTAGTLVFTKVTAWSLVDGNDNKNVHADCPCGFTASGGGHQQSAWDITGNFKAYVNTSMPWTEPDTGCEGGQRNRWTCGFTNRVDFERGFTCFAQCVKLVQP